MNSKKVLFHYWDITKSKGAGRVVQRRDGHIGTNYGMLWYLVKEVLTGQKSVHAYNYQN